MKAATYLAYILRPLRPRHIARNDNPTYRYERATDGTYSELRIK